MEEGFDDFGTLLSLASNLGSYYVSFDVPNKGNLTFFQTFLLVGITTKGYDEYVSEFSFEYSDSLDNPYQAYSQVFHYIFSLLLLYYCVTFIFQIFKVNTFHETAFVFEKPLLARRIQLSITDIVSGGSNIYYWKMNLFGCPGVNGE